MKRVRVQFFFVLVLLQRLLVGAKDKDVENPSFTKAVECRTAISPDREIQSSSTASSSESFEVLFVNNSPFRVTLYFRKDGGKQLNDLILIEPLILPGHQMKLMTFISHEFMFTREGTKDRLGDVMVVTPEVHTYELPKDAKSLNSCTDRYPEWCKEQADLGECGKNPGWMIVSCPVACESCHLLEKDKRCDPDFLNISREHIWKPGDLDSLFERVVQDHSFKTVELSKPPQGPWVIQLENFLSDIEIEALINHGHQLKFTRSTLSGPENARGETTRITHAETRTSYNAWCTGVCEEDPIVKDISRRIELMIGIPQVNFDSFQLLKYEAGQYYKVHHDMSPERGVKEGGHRILTIFLYLSDVEGGETEFPELGLKVTPKAGRAVMWPSVTNEDPSSQDLRTVHSSLAVLKGVKYGANIWVHSHNYKVARLWGCTGNIV